MKDSFPLQWPMGWERTPSSRRIKGSFTTKKELKTVFNLIAKEIMAFCKDPHPVLTSNMSGIKQTADDPAVAVYFKYEGRQVCIPCDQYDSIKANMRGIQLTIESLRGIQRWGCKVVMERTVHAYVVPMLTGGGWRETLQLPGNASLAEAERAYKKLALKNHPDQGGDSQKMAAINDAFNQARKELQ